MTPLLATLAAIYLVSACFVATIFTRALWRDRSVSATPAAETINSAGQATTQVPLAELHPITKSA